MYLFYRIFCLKSNLAEFLALYGGNLDFLDKFLIRAAKLLLNKIFCKKSTNDDKILKLSSIIFLSKPITPRVCMQRRSQGEKNSSVVH